jgi:hypothetical protein
MILSAQQTLSGVIGGRSFKRNGLRCAVRLKVKMQVDRSGRFSCIGTDCYIGVAPSESKGPDIRRRRNGLGYETLSP